MQTIMKTRVGFNEIDTTMTIEETMLYTSRIIRMSKIKRIYVELNGTLHDMMTKAERISELSDEMYCMLANIQNSDD